MHVNLRVYASGVFDTLATSSTSSTSSAVAGWVFLAIPKSSDGSRYTKSGKLQLGVDGFWALQQTSLFSCQLNALGEALRYVSSYPKCDVVEIVVDDPVYVAMCSSQKSLHEP
eukprot:6472609-Amphidinium_carterae.2